MSSFTAEVQRRWFTNRFVRFFTLLGFAHKESQSPFVRKAILVVIAASCLSATLAAQVRASDDESSAIDFPLVLLNGASVQRWRDHAAFMFNVAQHPQMGDAVDKWIDSTLKDLGGIDRERPFGVMLYLSSDFIGPPIGISYVPITNLDDALQTLAFGTGAITAVEGKKGWNTIRYGENFLIRTRQVGGYLFIVGPDGSEATLDRNFPEPARLASRLTSQYDVSVSLLIRNIQPAMKTLFVEMMKQSSLAELQQRDGEPESSYRLRRANGDTWLELLDHVVMQGEEFTIGARINPEQHQANFDIEIAGSSDSKLAKFFQNMAGKRTYFGNLLTNPSTFTMSISWLLSEKQRPLLTQFFEAARKEIGETSGKSGGASLGPVIDPLFKVLMASAETGHIDAFAQLVGNEPGKFALIAGTKVSGSRNLPTQISELLQYAKDNSNGNQQLSKLELATSEIDSSPVHQLEISPPDKPGQRMFGETAHLYLCATPQAIWVAFGGDDALPSLREAIAQAALPQDPAQSRNRAPLIFVTHASNWLSVANPQAVTFNEQARAAFEPSNDSLQLMVRPTDSGVRLRIEFEEGFIALMGRGFAKGIESGAFAPRPAGQPPRSGRPQQREATPAPAKN